jgi:hypothetical protein
MKPCNRLIPFRWTQNAIAACIVLGFFTAALIPFALLSLVILGTDFLLLRK